MENTPTLREVLDLATSIGYHILKNGGEINRAEDTATRIAHAYGVDYVHVFALSSTIVITMEKDGISLTQTRRVKAAVTNLNRIEGFNALSRQICKNPLPYSEVLGKIKEIESAHRYPVWVSVLSYALIGGSFSVFFGGGGFEFLAGFLIGSLIRLIMLCLENFRAVPFFVNAAGSAATVFLAHLFSFIIPSLNEELTTIGVLMNLVPGVLLTNCIRDFVATDFTAGTAKIIEAFFTATAIALGVAVSIIWR